MNDTGPSCQLIGAGRAGRVLAHAMTAAGYRFTWIGSRNADNARRLAVEVGAAAHGVGFENFPRPAGFLILAVPDGEIRRVSAEAAAAGVAGKRGTVAAHLSGALGSSELDDLRGEGASVMAFHPAQTFTPESDPRSVFRGICFDMEGDDPACALGEAVASSLGAVPVRLAPEQRVLTHLAMTVASNYTVSLVRMAETIMVRAGLPPETAHLMLKPLYMNTVRNISEYGASRALTGPVSRGDDEIVSRHLEALGAMGGGYRMIYKLLAEIALEITVERGDVAPERIERIRKILEHIPSPETL